MADSTHVQDAFVALIGQLLYPNGTKSPSAVDADCKIYPGWPDPNTLITDLRAKDIHVSVFGLPSSKPVPQMMAQWQELSIQAPTISLTSEGQTVTLSGTVQPMQNLVFQWHGGFISYAVQLNDTLESIATAIATIIPGASSAGAVITMPQGPFSANVSTPAKVLREVGRQQQTFQISIWAPTPSLRAAVAILIDPAIRVTERLAMPDGTAAGIAFGASQDDDSKQKQGLYIRHLRFTSEFATTQTQDAMTIGAIVVNTEVVQSIDPLEQSHAAECH